MGLDRDRLALLRHLETLEGSESVLEFVARCGVGYTEGKGTLRPYHLRPLIDLFLEAEQRGRVRACASVPPQMGKTTTILHAMVRYLQRNPRRHLAYIGYSHSFVLEKARDAQRVADAAGLRLSLNTVCDWRTPEGGGMTFSSKGGKLLGLKKDLVVVDDPHSGLQEATSPVETQRDVDWLMGTVLSRLSDPWGSVIVNGARWASTDLIGRLLDSDPTTWRYVNIPAILDEGKPEERALWPEVRSLEWLKEQRRQLNGSNVLIWPANYEGKPAVRGGQIFVEPRYYKHADLEGKYRIALGVDVASSPGRNDHSSVFVLSAKGHGADQVAEVLDYYTGQVSLGDLAEEIVRLHRKWGAEAWVETNGVGAGLPEIIRRIDPATRVHGETSIGNKYLRCQPAAAAWNDGRLRLKEGADYVPALVRRIRSFTGTGAEHDDDVDALGLAFRKVDKPLFGVRTNVHRLPGIM